jgi:hypothetical protein
MRALFVQLHNMYASPNIRVIKSRCISWEGHVACVGEMRNAYIILILKEETIPKF